MMLDRLVFDNEISLPFTFTVGCVRANVYVCSLILDDIVMNVVVKGGVLEFKGL